MVTISNKLLGKFHQRDKLFFFAAISSISGKLVNILVTIVSLPLIYNCIGKERYGMMLTITSISTLITFADLGLGFGLQSKIPILVKNLNGLHKLISSAFYFLVVSSLLIATFIFIVSVVVDWPTALHLKSSKAIEEVDISIWVFAMCIIIVIPLSIVQKLQLGLQKGYITNFWVTMGNIMGLVLLYVAYLNKASTPVIILCIYGSNAFFILLNFLYQFFIKDPFFLPRTNLVEFKLIKGILNESFYFFIVQMLSLVLFTSNNLFLIHSYGPDQVTEYNVVYKLVVLFLLPLDASAPYITPAINEAVSNNDYTWVKKSIRKLLILSLILAISTGSIAYFFGNSIINIWLGDGLVIDKNVLLSISIFMLLYANLGCALSYVMLSSKLIKSKTLFYTVAVIISLIVKFFWVKSFGVSGVFWSTTAPMFILYIVPCIVLLKIKKLV